MPIAAGNEQAYRCYCTEQSRYRGYNGSIADLLILKTTDSGFEHYIRDQFTTLKETK